jgi:hypothetical protein
MPALGGSSADVTEHAHEVLRTAGTTLADLRQQFSILVEHGLATGAVCHPDAVTDFVTGFSLAVGAVASGVAPRSSCLTVVDAPASRLLASAVSLPVITARRSSLAAVPSSVMAASTSCWRPARRARWALAAGGVVEPRRSSS